jgi:tetratricopeptide (TPR) repeat protein
MRPATRHKDKKTRLDLPHADMKKSYHRVARLIAVGSILGVMRAGFFILLVAPGLFAIAQSTPSVTPPPSLEAARQKLEHGQIKEAIEILQPMAAAQPPTRGAAHELGVAYYRAGKLLPAEQAFIQAEKEDANDIESVQMHGLTLYRLGRPAAAIPFLERVRQWTPDANADANYVLGLCYLNSQRYDDARAAFAAQYGVAASSGAAYLLSASMLMHANLPELAAQAAQKALEQTPKLPLAHFMLGEVYLYKSDVDRARQEFEQEREINPTYPAIYDRLGDVYLRTGKYQEAQQSLAKAISLDTSSTGPFILMGKVLLKKNDPQTAAMYLQHAEKMDPANYITHTLLGQAYRSLGKEAEAKAEIEAASKIQASSELKLEPVQ